MAGVGEASAIIAIAQFGVKFSVTVWEFAGEVRGARKEIGRLVNNIRTTSERLQEIGRLVKENPVSRLFNEVGIEGAVRCSKDCEDIIKDVTKVLVKEGREPSLRTLEQKDLDISKLEAWFWPFVKKKLVSPQAELERVKANLMLLLYTAMALKDSNPLQSKYALEIPRLKQWAEQATRRSEGIKHRTESSSSRTKMPTQPEAQRKDSEDDIDPEMRQRFLEFQIRLAEEAEDRRVQERAAFLHAEEVKRQEAEDASRKMLEQNAINAYKQEQEDRDARASEREKQLENALKEHGLEQEKIKSIMKIPYLQMSESGNANISVSKVRLHTSTEGDHEIPSTDASHPIRPLPSPSWLSRIFSKSGKAQTPLINEASGDGNRSKNGSRAGSVRMELWLIDVLSGRVIELEISPKWLDSHMKKTKHHDTLRRLAQMRHQWQMAVQHCLRLRNEREATGRLWRLFSIGFPRKMSRVPLFGHYHGDCLIQLAICQREDSDVSGQSAPWVLPPQLQIPDLSIASGHRDAPPVTSTVNKNPTTAEKSVTNVDANQVSVTGKGHIQKPVKSNLRAEKPDGLVNGIHTVIIEEGRDDRDDTALGGSTLIPKGLIQASALEELDYEFSHVPDGMENNPRQFLRVSSALGDDEIKKLVTVSREQINNQQAPSIRLPKSFKICRFDPEFKSIDRTSDSGSASTVEEVTGQGVIETDYRIYEDAFGDVEIEEKQTRITITHDRSDPHASDTSIRALDAKASTRTPIPASHDRVQLPRANSARDSRHYDIGSSSTDPRQHIRRDDTEYVYVPPRRPPVHTHHDSQRHLDDERGNRFTPRPALARREHGDRDRIRDSDDWMDDLGREAGADQDHYRKRSFERMRPFQKAVPEETNRMRPTFYGDGSIKGDVPKERKHYTMADLRPHESLGPWVDNELTITRRGEGNQLTVRPKQLKSRNNSKAAKPKDDTLYHPRMIASRRRDSDNSEPSERGAGRLVRFESRSKSRHPTRRLTRYKSSERTLSAHKDPEDSAQVQYREASNYSKILNITNAKEEEEDVISRTLKRYTTFNSDVDLVASPDEADASGLSDNDTFDVTTLEQARKTLRRLVEKQQKASKDGDLMTESDLKFYAIPDVEARVQQLTSQSEQEQPEQGLEDHEDEGERDGRHGAFQPDVPAHDPDHRTQESDVPAAPSGRPDRRHHEFSELEVDYDGEGESDPRSA